MAAGTQGMRREGQLPIYEEGLGSFSREATLLLTQGRRRGGRLPIYGEGLYSFSRDATRQYGAIVLTKHAGHDEGGTIAHIWGRLE